MDISISITTFAEITEDTLVVPVYESNSPATGVLAALDRKTGGNVRMVYEAGEFAGKKDESVLIHCAGNDSFRRLLLSGLGKEERVTPEDIQRLAGSAVRRLLKSGIETIAFLLPPNSEKDRTTRWLIEGALLGQEQSNIYSTNGDKRTLRRLAAVPETKTDSLAESVNVARIVAEATNFARLLGNEPGNVMTPIEMAHRASMMARSDGLAVEILDEVDLRKLGFGALMAVGCGSSEPPRLITLWYEPETTVDQTNCPLIALIGKGITFDSGGISIKPSAAMDEMKFDMCGGAAVLGAMQAIGKLRPRVRVMAIVAAAENLPSGRSYRPGDVITGLSGKTIEVTNTDAEGRLVLSDAITFAIRRGATQIIDLATLTGACVVALGEVRAGVMGNDRALIEGIIAAGRRAGERYWELPLDTEYSEAIQSPIADLKNDARGAGAIIAAAFLKEFAGTTPWAHLDIAGTAWTDKEHPHLAKGATGFGVKTLVDYVMNQSAG
ncbi:MAG TPA: leucyl aminopeptidase [Blastocatellia bacterium]|nr:leucyl aminopeptidase [Blastocatellia bacterium]